MFEFFPECLFKAYPFRVPSDAKVCLFSITAVIAELEDLRTSSVGVEEDLKHKLSSALKVMMMLPTRTCLTRNAA
eukprot:2862137-Rhodomonas_salina.1